MTIPAAFQPAVLKAFGKMVIARTNEVAATVVDKFKLSAITLQGTICTHGSMQVCTPHCAWMLQSEQNALQRVSYCVK